MTSTTRQSLRYRTRLPRLPANLEQESLQNGNVLLPRPSTPSSTPRPPCMPRPPSPLRPVHALFQAPIRSSAPAPAPDPGRPHRSSRQRLHPLLPPQQVTPAWRGAQPDRYLGLSGKITAADAAILKASSPARLSAVHNPANDGLPDGSPEGPSRAAREFALKSRGEQDFRRLVCGPERKRKIMVISIILIVSESWLYMYIYIYLYICIPD